MVEHKVARKMSERKKAKTNKQTNKGEIGQRK